MEPAEELYRSCQTVKPDWNDLGDVTKSVWRGYVAKGITVADYQPGQHFRPELEKTLLEKVFPMIEDKEPAPGAADPEVFADNVVNGAAATADIASNQAACDLGSAGQTAPPENLHVALHTSEPPQTITSSGEGYARAVHEKPLATWPTVTHSQKPLTLAERLALKKRQP